MGTESPLFSVDEANSGGAVFLAEGKKKNTAQLCAELAQPVAEQLGVELWDVRFEKE